MSFDNGRLAEDYWERAKQLLDYGRMDGRVYSPISHGLLHLNVDDTPQSCLRMPIQYRGGDILLPKEYEWVRPMVESARAILSLRRLRYNFTYLTVRKYVDVGQTAEEPHFDGFSMRVSHIPEQNFVWSETKGTEYFVGRYYLPEGFHPMLHNINKCICLPEDEDGGWWEAKPSELIQFDPYVLHKAPVSDNKNRVFVRVSFVPIEIDDVNNTQNPLLPRTYTVDGVKSFRNTLLGYDWEKEEYYQIGGENA